jgi:predicted regulator of amino acid metabolism with ACT domain
MWDIISHEFSHAPSQASVAKFFLETGIRVNKDQIFMSKVRLTHSQVAKALDKDKRIVTATVRTINANPRLYGIFSKLRPICNLIEVAPSRGWGTLEITLSDPALPGILGSFARTIGDSGISIRQVIGQDPTHSDASFYIITDKPLPGKLLEKLRRITGVEKISLLKI